MSVIRLEDCKKLKKKKSRYPLTGNNREILTSNDVDELVKQGK